jgi:hypothetical protein
MDQLDNAIDQSSYIVKVSFADESGTAITPTTASWTLTDGDGEIVNSREDVAITSLASSVYIALSGDDLVAGTTRAENLRCLVIEGTYSSSLVGGTLPVKEAVKFLIEDLPQV